MTMLRTMFSVPVFSVQYPVFSNPRNYKVTYAYIEIKRCRAKNRKATQGARLCKLLVKTFLSNYPGAWPSGVIG